MNSKQTRRRFLRQGSCAGMSSLPVLNTLLNLKLAGDLAAVSTAGNGDYRALVCLFLSGGIDSYNLLVPAGSAEYQEYRSVRSANNIALPRESLLPLNALGSPGVQLGVHPGLAGVQSLFNAGKAAFVANVGTLIEPVTKDQYQNNTKRLPLGLYSHSDQIEQWQTSVSDKRSSVGWAGRVADLLHSLNAPTSTGMNISLSGSNTWQTGDNTVHYTINTDGAEPLRGYDPSNTNDPITVIRTRAIDRQLGLDYQHVLTNVLAQKKANAVDAYKAFNAATTVDLPASVIWPKVSTPTPSDPTPADTYLAQQFQMVAKSIKGHQALGHTRQTFFVEVSDWDHHDNLISRQAALVPGVDAAVKAFYDTLAALGLENNVTLFTASDFARTLKGNAGGSDHAWGGNHFVVGGAVKGQHIFGRYPQLYSDAPQDVGDGRLVPETSVDSYFAELALWFGVPASSLSTILPNIGNFYTPGGSDAPVGFMA